jgi:hypothetical protein
MKGDGPRVVIVPPSLGYGANGVRGTIPPNAVLAFLITLKSATFKGKPAQPVSRPVQPIKSEQPAREIQVRRGLWDEEEEEDVHPRDVRVVAAISDAELLQWMDGLTDLLRGRLEALALTASQTMDPGEALDEVRPLAAEVEDKEQQFMEQQQIIDELSRTKQNIRLRIELDIAQTELQSPQALLRCGRDFRRENDYLRVELRHVRDVGVGELTIDTN